MQIDMHYYGVFALARAAGITQNAAKIIAYASQYVDDATDNCFMDLRERGAMFPVMTSHKPLDVLHNADPEEQWKVWVAYHFLPGNLLRDHPENSPYALFERLICRPGMDDNEFAQSILRHALSHKDKEYFLHIVGVTAHVFADTFSHYGFIGLSHPWNKADDETIDFEEIGEEIKNYIRDKYDLFKTRIMGAAAEAVPVGHGSVGTYPDRPYLKWKFKYESKKDAHGIMIDELQERDNPTNFLEASKRLFLFFKLVSQAKPDIAEGAGKEWAEIEQAIRSILIHPGKEEERCGKWCDFIMSNESFPAPREQAEIGYDPDAWSFRKAEREYKKGIAVGSNSCNFIRAARVHRNYVLYTLLPESGMILA